jgi:hypothetical protein
MRLWTATRARSISHSAFVLVWLRVAAGSAAAADDKFVICMRACVRAHYAGIRARVMNWTETAGDKGWSVGTSACENRRFGRKPSNRKTKHTKKKLLGIFHPFSSFSASSCFSESSCHTQLPHIQFILGIILTLVVWSLSGALFCSQLSQYFCIGLSMILYLNLRLQLSTPTMVQGTQHQCAENPEPTRLLLQF